MNKCLKLTMTVAAVALMCVSFAPQAQAYNEGDVALFQFSYLPQNPDNTLRTLSGNYQNSSSVKEEIWPASVYNEAFGQHELNVAQFLGTYPTFEPASFWIPITISDTGFPNMVTWVKDQNYQNGARTAVSFFRVGTDGTVQMWRANGPHGTAPYGDIQGVADLVTVTACLAAYNGTQINALGVILNVGGCLVVGGDPGATQPGLAAGGGGGGADLSGLEAGQAAIEAKLDNLPAGPQGPAGDAGPTGDAGADAACTPCADVTDAAVALACEILGENPPTSVSALQATSQVVVDTLLISTNICEADCDISAGIQAAIDAKLSQ
jgi:hypothetical protein